MLWVVSCTPKVVLLGVGERRRKKGGNEVENNRTEVEERKEKPRSKRSADKVSSKRVTEDLQREPVSPCPSPLYSYPPARPLWFLVSTPTKIKGTTNIRIQ